MNMDEQKKCIDTILDNFEQITIKPDTFLK